MCCRLVEETLALLTSKGLQMILRVGVERMGNKTMGRSRINSRLWVCKHGVERQRVSERLFVKASC